MRREHTIEEKEPRDPGVTAAEVLAHLAKLNDAASIRQIAHGMDLRHHGRRYLPRLIKQLKRSGAIEEIYGGRYRLPEEETKSAARARRSSERASQSQHQRKQKPDSAPQAARNAASPSAGKSAPPSQQSGRARDPKDRKSVV